MEEYEKPPHLVNRAALHDLWERLFPELNMCRTCDRDFLYIYHKLRRINNTKNESTMSEQKHTGKYRMKDQNACISILGNRAVINAGNVHKYDKIIDATPEIKKHFVLNEQEPKQPSKTKKRSDK